MKIGESKIFLSIFIIFVIIGISGGSIYIYQKYYQSKLKKQDLIYRNSLKLECMEIAKTDAGHIRDSTYDRCLNSLTQDVYDK